MQRALVGASPARRRRVRDQESNAAVPTKIFSYGAHAPTVNEDVVRRQLSLANRYRNALVAIERWRFRRCQEALHRAAPRLGPLEERAKAIESSLAAHREALDLERAHARKRVANPARSRKIAELVKELSAAWEACKPVRKEGYAMESFKEDQEAIVARRTDRIRRFRARIVNLGLYWGTYLIVEESVEQARRSSAKFGEPPSFRRFTGEGRVAVQIQKGMSVPDLLGGLDKRLRLAVSERPGAVPGSHRAELRKDGIAYLRVGSEGRAPIFAETEVRVHRLPPVDWRIKWAWLLVRKVGSREEWRLQIVATGDEEPVRLSEEVVGIDVGWRMVGGEGRVVSVDPSEIAWRRGAKRSPGPRRLRVAYFTGTKEVTEVPRDLAGHVRLDEGGKSGELYLGPEWLDRMAKVRDLQSIRREAFDAVVAKLLAFQSSLRGGLVPATRGSSSDQTEPARGVARGVGSSDADNPSWWPTNLGQWKSQGRLSALVRWWRDNRFAGDEEGYAVANEWRLRERHLLDYEDGMRQRLRRHREATYRRFASWLKETFGKARVERLKLGEFHENPEAEEGSKDGALKEHVRDACLHSLLRCLKESRICLEKVKAAWTTRDCRCGHENAWPEQKSLLLECAGCGAIWDQDRNASENILGAGTDARGEEIDDAA